MRRVVIGAHLRREDIEPLAEAIEADELFLSSLSVPDEQPIGDRDLLLRVADIRAQLLGRATFIAIRYGLVLSSDAEAFTKTAAHLPRWKQKLLAHREHAEMTLKVAAHAPLARPDRRDFASGADYLRALHSAVRSASVEPAFHAAVERLLLPLAVTAKWQTRDERAVEWTALIRRDDVETMNAAAGTLRAECATTPFLFSGPWPLEVFADDHE